MDIQVVVRGVDDGAKGLRQLSEEKITAALDRFESDVISVRIRVEDETGPAKNGVDKWCSVDVKTRTGEVVIKEQADQFEAAIHAAADRLRQTMSRERAKLKHGIGEG